MRDFFDVRAVDAQAVLEQQIVYLADRARGRVFNRHHAHIRFAVAHRAEHLFPGGHVLRLALWKQRTRRQFLIGARHALIVDGFRVERRLHRVEGEAFGLLAQQLAVLIFTAGADHALQQRGVFEPQLLIHTGGAFFNDLGLAVGFIDFIVGLCLGLCNLERERHPPQEQRADLFVHIIDVLPDRRQFTHSRSPPSKDLPARSHKPPRRPALRA